MYVNIHSSEKVARTVDEILTIREMLSKNLREGIVELQDQFLALPQHFKDNPQETILEAITRSYTIADRRELRGRSSYKSLFSRQHRRNLVQGKFVVQDRGNDVTLSYGLFKDESFTEKVVQLAIKTKAPQRTEEEISALIAAVEQQASAPNRLQQKVLSLNALIADTGLHVEEARNEILQHVEHIRGKEQFLTTTRDQQKHFTLAMGLSAILANMIVLFVLVRRIVELPLRSLTDTIDKIQQGKLPDIPPCRQGDQIGVLTEAIRKFRGALVEIQEENKRKFQEKVIIDNLVDSTTAIIHELDTQAQELVVLSGTLQNLATTTGTQSDEVNHRASDTAMHTHTVARSATNLQEVTEQLTHQITDQSRLVDGILLKNAASHDHMGQLAAAVKEIDNIISMVNDITEQTNLLALNATIEAARAGQAGNGFAVVATEIKSLSHNTDKATSDVMAKVSAINGARTTLMANFNDIDNQLKTLADVTGTISEAVELQQGAVNTITDLTSKTSTNTCEVSKSITQVNSAASQTSSLSQQVHSYASSIATQLVHLLNQTTSTLDQISTTETCDQKLLP